MIVYPMGLPPYDPIELEFKNQEELEGTQVNKSSSKFFKNIRFYDVFVLG